MTTETTPHTPGPWVHNPAPEPQNADRHICIDIPSGFARVIARVKHTAVDNALANARLVAAAPEMARALQDFLDAAQEIGPYVALPFVKAMDNARALLRRIE